MSRTENADLRTIAGFNTYIEGQDYTACHWLKNEGVMYCSDCPLPCCMDEDEVDSATKRRWVMKAKLLRLL